MKSPPSLPAQYQSFNFLVFACWSPPLYHAGFLMSGERASGNVNHLFRHAFPLGLFIHRNKIWRSGPAASVINLEVASRSGIIHEKRLTIQSDLPGIGPGKSMTSEPP